MQQEVDRFAQKNRHRRTWSSGDCAAISVRMVILSETLCEAVDIRGGERVLDVACGIGNGALAAARRFADAVGVDYVSEALTRGRRRAEADGLEVQFVDADAQRLPFADASFDAVLSVAGVMFAADQERAAAELQRVCRPGGRIGLVNWRADGFLGEMLALWDRYAPRPPGHKHAALWGSEARLRELFGAAPEIDATRRVFRFRFRSPERYVEFMCSRYGPYARTLEDLEIDARRSIRAELLDAAVRANLCRAGSLILPMDYLEAVIRLPRSGTAVRGRSS